MGRVLELPQLIALNPVANPDLAHQSQETIKMNSRAIFIHNSMINYGDRRREED